LKKNPTGRRWRRLGLAAAILLMGLGILSLPWRGSRPAAPPAVLHAAGGRGPLSAGAATRLVEPGDHPVIAGFPRLRWAAEGSRDPLHLRALVLSVPGCRVAVVSAELLLVPEALVAAVQHRVASLGLDALIIGASHTHAGLGGYWDSRLGAVAATGPYDPAVADRLADQMAEAIAEALASAGPAEVQVGRGRFPSLVRNRAGASPDGRAVRVDLLRGDGTPLATLLSFAAHATILGSSNRQLSGDWPGRLGARPGAPPLLFFQGAVGDQSAVVPPGADDRPAGFAAALSDRLSTVVPEAPPEAAPVLAVAEAEVTLPPVRPGVVPTLLRPAAWTLLGGALPATARVTALRLDGVLLLFTPAEPVEAVGAAWRAAAGPGAEAISLANGYVGYVDTSARFSAGAGEAHRSYYGAGLAERLEAAVVAAARAADARAPPPARERSAGGPG
jgi:hypothetical protein